MIDKNEVLRYLGYKENMPKGGIEDLIDKASQKVLQTSRPKTISGLFDIERKDSQVLLNGTDVILGGKDIYDYLNGAKKCYLIAATLGIEIDRILMVAEKTDMVQAVILDACCNDYIEKICDSYQQELSLEHKDKFMDTRFSPGYGDLDISLQPKILRIINAEKRAGITVTNSSMMIPRKSVTAIVGVFESDIDKYYKCERKCDYCNLKETCAYRKKVM